jgi:putative transposase
VGYHAGLHRRAQPWLTALGRAVNRPFPAGVREQGLSLVSDDGCQPTSAAFMRACSTLGIHQALTGDNHPKGDADTERVGRTVKGEGPWPHEWTCPFAVASALATWIDDHNEHYLYSALGYNTPRQYEREHSLSHGT